MHNVKEIGIQQQRLGHGCDWVFCTLLGMGLTMAYGVSQKMYCSTRMFDTFLQSVVVDLNCVSF